VRRRSLAIAPSTGRLRRLGRAMAVLFVAGLAAASLAGCSGGGSGTVTASAVFSDVSDLVAGAPVQFENISVGSVKSISLDGNSAKVTMSIDKTADVPADVTAKLQQTTILGEHFVSLVSSDDSGPPLHNGEVITNTVYVPGIQQLVSAGTEVFSAVNAAEVAEMIDNGAQGFGNQSAQLSALLDNFDTVLGGYASRSTEIQSVIDQFEKFSATLAPDAQQNAQAVSNLAQTTQTLFQQSGQFEQLLQSLDDLAVQGRSILDSGVPQTEDQINALAAVAKQLYENQQGLAELLQYLPGHNSTVSSAVDNNFVQVLNDVIVCGVPGGGSSPQYATTTCAGAG
jgi:phospholipid/cholesterol/gamma-HCH transport system substrate-binding protein